MRYSILLLVFSILYTAAYARDGRIPFNGGSIFYSEKGKGSPVILVHAGFQDGSMWKHQVDHFSKKYRVIVPDLPGHGKTVGGKERPFAAEILKVLMDSLKLDKAYLAGLSLGGAIVTEFAVQYPERVKAIVLAASGLPGWDVNRKLDTSTTIYAKELFGALEKKDTTTAARVFVDYWYRGPHRKNSVFSKKLWTYGYGLTLGNMKKHRVSGWPTFTEGGVVERLQEISVPVLILTGRLDMPEVLLLNHYLFQNIKGSRQIYFERSAHMINLEENTKFNRELDAFLTEVSGKK